MATISAILGRVSELARTMGDALQLRGFKAGGAEGQVPVKGAGGDFDWTWGDAGVLIISSVTPPTDHNSLWDDRLDGSLNYWNGSVWVSTSIETDALPELTYLTSTGGGYITSTGGFYTSAA